MYNRIYSFLNKHNILSTCQFGFRPGRSTELALVDALDNLNKAAAKKETSIGVFLDLSKAFDTIDHGILLTKLSYYGFRGVSFSWIKSYLSNRKQFTSLNGVTSDLMEVKCGVPQGSILGPLFFLIYVNDISSVSKKASLVLFADDTNIFFSGSDPQRLEELVSHELKLYFDWFTVNKLSLNVAKTNFIVFNKDALNMGHEFKISIDGNCLQRVENVKFLGIHIDSKLSWNEHVYNISSQIAKVVGILGRLKYIVPRNSLRSIYLALIYPHLSYCSIAWSSTSRSLFNKLNVLQKRAIRHITCSKPRDHTSSMFKSLNLLKLTDIFKTNIATFTYRSLHNLLPSQFSNYFSYNSSVHNHNTRQSASLHQDSIQSSLQHNSLRNRAIRLWNCLPSPVIAKQSTKSFRKSISRTFIQDY